jgi:hypothetical protein
MYASQTNGLALYQQAVSQTAGIAPSTWFQSTSPQPPSLVHLVPMTVEKKDQKAFKEKTA